MGRYTKNMAGFHAASGCNRASMMQRRGVSGPAYGLLVGLIAIAVVGSVRGAGNSVFDVFAIGSNRLATAVEGNFSDSVSEDLSNSVGRGNDVCGGALLGETCANGAIYAGEHPMLSGVEILAAPEDAGSAVTWNDGGMTYPSSAVWETCSNGTNEVCRDGRDGTEALATGDDGEYLAADGSSLGQPGTNGPKHQAAEACAGLSAAGNANWHLPSPMVVDVLYERLVAEDDPDNPLNASDLNQSGAGDLNPNGLNGPAANGFATESDDFYWSVAEVPAGASGDTTVADQALVTDFVDGRMTGRFKDAAGNVRCVRFLEQ